MNIKVESQQSTADTIKLALAIIIVTAAIGGYYYFADYSQLLRVLGVVGSTIVALLVAGQTMIGRATWTFMSDARMETRKVVWPTKQETIQVTLVVILVVFIVGLILWGLDSLLGWGIQSLLSTEGR
jgi:preprotein translocase subunit SecE